MADVFDTPGLRAARRWGTVCGFFHGLAAIPVLAILLLWMEARQGEFTLLVVRDADAPSGTIVATIDGQPLTPRLAGEAGIEFQTERRRRREVTLELSVNGAPDTRWERRLRQRDVSCPVVARLDREGFIAGECMWRPAYWN
jgi:hypothetical protein